MDDVNGRKGGEDFAAVPVRAMRTSACRKMSSMLNVTKVIPTREGLFRDWRGLAELLDLDSGTIQILESKSDPTAEMLSLWPKTGTFHDLTVHLARLDRYDIADDIWDYLVQDSESYLKKREDVHDPQLISGEVDSTVLTIGDSARLGQGLAVERYDAFLLYAEDDTDFAMEMVRKMEDEYGMKLCLRDRDLVGGLPFEHDAIAKLIEERCNRLVVIFSPAFIESKANQFVLMFAQALGIEQRQRKIIPCIYKHCDLPATIRCAFCLDYTRSGKLWNFWERLRDSLQAQPKAIRSNLVVENKESQIHQLTHSMEVKKPEATATKEKVRSISLGCKSAAQVTKREHSHSDSGVCSEPSTTNTNGEMSKSTSSDLGSPVPLTSWFKRLLPKPGNRYRKVSHSKLLAE